MNQRPQELHLVALSAMVIAVRGIILWARALSAPQVHVAGEAVVSLALTALDRSSRQRTWISLHSGITRQA